MSSTSYEYVAFDRHGLRVRGVARGQTQADVVRQIAAGGLTPVRVRRARILRRRGRIGQQEIAQFTLQLATLVNARVPIGEGLRSIAEQEPDGALREMVLRIAGRIEAGERIAVAMGEHERVLGPVYIQTVDAAERSGNLVKVLEYLSELTERQSEMRQQVRGALAYPACVVGVLVVAVLFLVGFVVPKFARMFAERGVELPIFTRVLMSAGELLQSFWWLVAVLAVASGLVLRRAWSAPRGRAFIERVLLRVPILSQLLRGLAVARLTRVLGLCIGSGIPLLDALSMSSRAAGSPALGADVDRMADQVRRGSRMSGAMATAESLPAFAKRMLASGEESAELPRMCGLIARHYERQTASLTKNLSTAIEPVLIVAIAGVVLVIALAIFLPMWNMVTLMER